MDSVFYISTTTTINRTTGLSFLKAGSETIIIPSDTVQNAYLVNGEISLFLLDADGVAAEISSIGIEYNEFSILETTDGGRSQTKQDLIAINALTTDILTLDYIVEGDVDTAGYADSESKITIYKNAVAIASVVSAGGLGDNAGKLDGEGGDASGGGGGVVTGLVIIPRADGYPGVEFGGSFGETGSVNVRGDVYPEAKAAVSGYKGGDGLVVIYFSKE